MELVRTNIRTKYVYGHLGDLAENFVFIIENLLRKPLLIQTILDVLFRLGEHAKTGLSHIRRLRGNFDDR